ncbi:MAG: electron transporter RnfG, partial [Sulfuricella sp.]
MSTSILRHASSSAGILTAFAVVGTALLAATYLVTRPIIAETEKQAKLALIGQILPATLYDNDLLKNAALLPPTR